MPDEVHDGVIGIARCGGGGDGCGRGVEVRGEFVDGERSEVAAVEGVGVEVQDCLSDGGSGCSDDGFR